MDTGVAPVDGSEAEEIAFKFRQKTCQVARVTGTQSQENDLEAASKLWEELEREEEPTYCPFRIVGWFLSVSCFLYLYSRKL